MIDWRSIFKRHMNDVCGAEGIDYLDRDHYSHEERVAIGEVMVELETDWERERGPHKREAWEEEIKATNQRWIDNWISP